ncbi:hypothetical protein GGI35DRAFT_412272 [Trichoderma velutinum]
MPSMPRNALATPCHYWASWALTASQGPPTARCSVRPSGPKRLRGRLIPVRPCTFADRVQPPRAPGATERPAARSSSWPPAAQVDRLDRARAGASTGFWVQYCESQMPSTIATVGCSSTHHHVPSLGARNPTKFPCEWRASSASSLPKMCGSKRHSTTHDMRLLVRSQTKPPSVTEYNPPYPTEYLVFSITHKRSSTCKK